MHQKGKTVVREGYSEQFTREEANKCLANLENKKSSRGRPHSELIYEVRGRRNAYRAGYVV